MPSHEFRFDLQVALPLPAQGIQTVGRLVYPLRQDANMFASESVHCFRQGTDIAAIQCDPIIYLKNDHFINIPTAKDSKYSAPLRVVVIRTAFVDEFQPFLLRAIIENLAVIP